MAKLLLPLPLGPQHTVILPRGMSTVMSLRLCCFAPTTRITSCRLPSTSSRAEGFSRSGSARRRFLRRAEPDLLPAACSDRTEDMPTEEGGHATRPERTPRSASPVYDLFDRAIFSGVPSATKRPPAAPPSGPRSITQSAVLMTSRLCSMTTTVLPASTNPCRTANNRLMSAKCSPVVGSSSRYIVRPVDRFTSSRASLIRWASPPESVVEDCPSLR